MSTQTATRRSLIGNGGALVAAAILTAGRDASAQSAVSPNARLHRAMALHDRVDAEYQRFESEVVGPARQACHAAIEAVPRETPPPHEQSTTTFVNMFGDTVRLTTENVGIMAVARRVAADPDWSNTGDEDWRQAHREIAAAGDRRDAVLAEQAGQRELLEKEKRSAFRIDEIEDRSIALADRRDRLWQAALSTPASTLGDVVAKLDFIDRTVSEDVGEHELRVIAADVRRLAGEA